MKLIERYGAPDQKQIGSVKDLYVDLDTNDVYRCTGIKTVGEELGGSSVYASTWGNTEYTWEKLGGSGGGAILAEMQEVDADAAPYIVATNFEEFYGDAMYIVHYGDEKVLIYGESRRAVAEDVDPDPNTIVIYGFQDQIVSKALYIVPSNGDEVTITQDAIDERYTVFTTGDATFTIAIERITSAIA